MTKKENRRFDREVERLREKLLQVLDEFDDADVIAVTFAHLLGAFIGTNSTTNELRQARIDAVFELVSDTAHSCRAVRDTENDKQAIH
jgi:hypothetical protein